MKLSYLIIAHQQPELFKRLLHKLLLGESEIFVFIDARADIDLFKINSERVHFLKNRFVINRGGFSQTQAMIRLLEFSEKSKSDFFVFLSGQDYPIKPIFKLEDFLTSNPNKNFISFYELHHSAEYLHHLNRYYLTDFLSKTPLAFRWILQNCLRVLNMLGAPRKFFKNIKPYRGSTSWVLNADTVHYILNFVYQKQGKALLRYMSWCWGSDEMFFQTVVLNSPFKTQCFLFAECQSIEKPTNENKAYLHYIDWSNHREMPAVLTEHDFEILQQSSCFFARKFDIEKSKSLLDALDRMD